MARIIGDSIFSANFEPRKASPLDSRSIVDYKNDLILLNTWNKGDGNAYVYKGMLVSVINDLTTTNNGVYILTDNDYTNIDNWELIGTNNNSGENISWIVEFTGHEFSVMQPVFFYPSNGALEVANTTELNDAGTHIITNIIDEDHVEVGQSGKFTISSHGFSTGKWYRENSTWTKTPQTKIS